MTTTRCCDVVDPADVVVGVSVDFDDGVVQVDHDGAVDPLQHRRAFGQSRQ